MLFSTSVNLKFRHFKFRAKARRLHLMRPFWRSQKRFGAARSQRSWWSTDCIFAARKRRFFCISCRKHKKMQSARSNRSLRSIPLIVPLSFSKTNRIFAVMRPDPDLTQTGVRRSGFIEIYLINQHEYFLNDINQIPASGGQFMPTCGVLPMVFPVVLCYTERKDANAAETGRFSACTVSILQNGVSGWS